MSLFRCNSFAFSDQLRPAIIKHHKKIEKNTSEVTFYEKKKLDIST